MPEGSVFYIFDQGEKETRQVYISQAISAAVVRRMVKTSF